MWNPQRSDVTSRPNDIRRGLNELNCVNGKQADLDDKPFCGTAGPALALSEQELDLEFREQRAVMLTQYVAR